MSFHKQQKCFGLQPLTPPLIKAPLKNVEIWGGGGGMRREDDVEKVGRTSGKILATPLLKPEKTTGVLNVLIICPGSHFQGSVDQESFMTKWKLLVASSEKKGDNGGKRSFCEM